MVGANVRNTWKLCIIVCLLVCINQALVFPTLSATKHVNRDRYLQRFMSTSSSDNSMPNQRWVSSESDREKLWKEISGLEKKAVELLCLGKDKDIEEAYELLSQSVTLKKSDPFLQLAESYGAAAATSDKEECARLMTAMKIANVPPHLSSLVGLRQEHNKSALISTADTGDDANAVEVVQYMSDDNLDLGSTFSDTVTDKVRVKVHSFFDNEKSDPANGKYMFWYKVAIYNEGAEPVQVISRMWEIENFKGKKDVVRGAGIMSTQPIISAGDVFTYQSVCPLKVFPPKGKRLLGSMSGAYTLCKGAMGQHSFAVNVSKFNLILPEPVVESATEISSNSSN